MATRDNMASNPQTVSPVLIHPPNSSHPSLADNEAGFDRSWFMGNWAVEWSTLPMWKDKRDVVISYEPVASGSKVNTIFNSSVEYHKGSAGKDAKPSTVKGSETLSTGMNGANFDWKGSGMLFFVHSHWEVLGYGKDEAAEHEWAVTFFSKTLFTPAGIDIYVRHTSSTAATPHPDAKAKLKTSIVEAIRACEDEGVRRLSEGGFNVPGQGV